MLRSGKIIFLAAFFAFLIQALVFFIDKPDELMAVPLVLILGAAGAYWLSNNSDPDSDFQVNIFLIAFSIRILVGMLIYGWDMTAIFADEDASGYFAGWTRAENWYKNGIDGFISDLSLVFFEKANIGQSVLWGIPMFIAGGPSRMIVSVMNSFAGGLLAIVIFRLARRIFDSQIARIAAILSVFWASFVLLSAGTSKEVLVILFEWTLLYIAMRNPQGLTAKDGAAAIPAFLALYATRFYALYIVAAAFLFRAITSGGRNLVRNAVLATFAVGTVMFVLNAGGVITRDFDHLELRSTIMEDWRQNMARHTGSGVEIYSQFQNQNVAVPVATVYFFFAPFPWEMFSGSVRNGFGAVENIAIIAILIIGFPAFGIFFREKFFEIAPILVFCVLYAGLQIWGLSNVGLAWRHKQTVMPLFFILVAVGITQRRAGWRALSSRFARDSERVRILPTN